MSDRGWMSMVFDPEPEQWGLRGDPHVWRAMRDLLAQTYQPETVAEGRRLLEDTFRSVVGLGMHDTASEDRVFRPQFNSGGMSGGWVDLGTWWERLLPLLTGRLGTRASTSGAGGR